MVMIPDAPSLGDMPTSSPFPDGVYYIRCDKAKYEIAKSEKKTPMAVCQFVVFGPAEQEEFHGRKTFENLMLKGEGMFRTRQFLECAGKDESFRLEDTDQLVGLECGAVIEVVEAWTDDAGKSYPARNQIKRFLKIE